ncbi:endolytic transglycosylase MltG [Sediminicola luteus]|uniref:Endolytic murein transglycosylase n=1 Tax=Sediminicola luteus TaxID=319238 RepID=A0A2A4G6P5_9FLAO|nr:endolytic transglycosylase MltG [Sediminicola luteus]PCE63650.1 aminodeoxychorismate lyase [Sediminicola luteus]
MYLKKIVWAIAIIGVLIGGFFAYTIYSAIFNPNTAFDSDKVTLYIPSDSEPAYIKSVMDTLLTDPEAFMSLAKRKGYLSNIKAGKFSLTKDMNNNDIVNRLRSGNEPVRVSFNNQESIAKLAGRIATQIEADSIDLVKQLSALDFYKNNNIPEAGILGMYLPNSYEFYWNTSAEQFQERMLKEYQKFWSGDRKEKAEQLGMSPHEVSTLASVVHKESAKVDERPRIAGVYLNRLKQGIALQADPTVIFAIKKHTGNYDTIVKRVLYRDLEIDSPYNTYKYAGLPPGPITMPDISAIDGVLNPEKHDYLFFVADVSNFGYHKFAKTLRQHNENKKQYIAWLRKQKIKR